MSRSIEDMRAAFNALAERWATVLVSDNEECRQPIVGSIGACNDTCSPRASSANSFLKSIDLPCIELSTRY